MAAEHPEQTDYTNITDQYRRSKLEPWRVHVEEHMMRTLAGDLGGKTVLDLACGEGFLTRRLKQWGADRVLGIDRSAAMIELAKSQQDDSSGGVDYRVAEVVGLELGERFDVIAAGWLLCYSRTSAELLAMARTIEQHLAPGGRFFSLTGAPEHSPAHFDATRPYGFTKSAASPELADGTPITWTFTLPNGETFELDNYYLSEGTHEKVFAEAGLSDFVWHRAQVSSAGLAEYGHEFWKAFLEDPPMVCLEVKRA
ncbi:Ubiquinone biosynthesis O-methyltransferase [Planctomycetes bacterium Pan216]|uniref:Ubiquinone biosynthesis O-methyltransferase n=1 Tax=Kolteria novifilia TaxID=2527975 RepID=A0A518AYW0_9BACT|nr:Ubiquinone biosynthesis O-methyltransferase [Planctomycetes bacterium Pan216]